MTTAMPRTAPAALARLRGGRFVTERVPGPAGREEERERGKDECGREMWPIHPKSPSNGGCRRLDIRPGKYQATTRELRRGER